MTAYLPELLTPVGSFPLTDEEADVLMRAMVAMRGRRPGGRGAVRLLTEAGDRHACALVDGGMPPEAVAEVMGVSVGSVLGAVRRVECGRYG